MVTTVNFREIQKIEEDFGLVHGAAMLVLTEIGDNHSPDAEEVEYVMGDINSDRRTTVVAFDDEDKVLAVGGLEIDGDEGTIVDVATSPEKRGENLGRYIVGQLEKKARDAGVKKLSLFSLAGAGGFYDKLGYQAAGKSSFLKLLQV